MKIKLNHLLIFISTAVLMLSACSTNENAPSKERNSSLRPSLSLDRLDDILAQKRTLNDIPWPQLSISTESIPLDLDRSISGQLLKLRYPGLKPDEAIRKASEEAVDMLEKACLHANGVKCDPKTLMNLEDNRPQVIRAVEILANKAIQNEIKNADNYVATYESVRASEIPYLSALKKLSEYEALQDVGSFYPIENAAKETMSKSSGGGFFDVFDAPLTSHLFEFINLGEKERSLKEQFEEKMTRYSDAEKISAMAKDLSNQKVNLSEDQNLLLQVFVPINKQTTPPLGAFLNAAEQGVSSDALRQVNLESNQIISKALGNFLTEKKADESIGPEGSRLNLLSQKLAQLFKDPLDTWEPIDDARFKNMDLRAFFAKNVEIRRELSDMREKFIDKFWQLFNEPNGDFTQLTKEMTEATKEWTAKHMEMALPAGLNQSEMAFIAFGSMARLESGPYTDLEGAALFPDDAAEAKTLIQVFAQALANDFFGALEHPLTGIKGWRLDEADNSPFHKAPFASDVPMKTAYCMALKSISPPLPKLTRKITDAEQEAKDLAEFRHSQFYPFEGSLAFSTTAQDLADYFKSADYEFPAYGPLFLYATAKDKLTDWYKFGSQFFYAREMHPQYIAKELAKGSCASSMTAREIADSAQKIADKMSFKEIEVIKNFTLIGRNHTYVFGNKSFYADFVKFGRERLSEHHRRTRLAMKFLYDLTHFFANKKYNGGTMFFLGQLPGAFDLKRQLYRFEEQVHTNMGFLKALPVQNQADIVEALMASGVYGKEFGRKTLKRINYLNALRWKDQALVHGQLESRFNFSTQEAYDEKVKEMAEAYEANKLIVDHPEKHKPMQVAMAKLSMSDIKANAKKLPALDPSNENPIFGPQELTYMRNQLIPQQMELYRRTVAFTGYENEGRGHSIPPNPNAFHDDFNWKKVNLERYGATLK